jgi:trehalose 2-sulfotransferase
MKPKLSYTIWFTQRTGSTLLCRALESTGVAGHPNEWLYTWLGEQQVQSAADLQRHLWENGSTANGVFGLKHSFHEPHFTELIQTFRQFPGVPTSESNRVRIWEHALPNHRHIFMTRRNKVRLAVSWWKAVKTAEWHLLPGETRKAIDLHDGYSFEAINHLYAECSMREAGIQEFFSEGGIVPLTIVYEDFIQEYENTVRKILAFLELDANTPEISPPSLSPTADTISEEWVQRFRKELQEGWSHRGW